MEIIKVNFPDDQYVKVLTQKDILVIHHSAGRDDAIKMFDHWAKDKQGRVSTAYGITRNGKIYQGFSTKYWGYALYVNSPANDIPKEYKKSSWDANINSRAIQVELCNWGGLMEKNNKLYAWPEKYSKVEVPRSEAVYYPSKYQGFNWFHNYTNAQIDALKTLILFHHDQDNIILDYHEDMWDTNSQRALRGTPGIWTHTSFRTDKSDCHPQDELVSMLRGLSNNFVENTNLIFV